MGNIVETSSFDPTVYQWETTDPVVGGASGIANTPLRNLANRTRWLADQLTVLDYEISLRALNNSPQITGSPTAPTPLPSASGTEVVTAAFVRGLFSGISIIAMTGQTTLTTVQAGAGVIVLVGSTTADSFLLFPPGNGTWIVSNGTNHHVICRQASGGFTVSVAPGYDKIVWTDGVNFASAVTDFEDTLLSGSSKVNTPPTGDSSTLIPNTAWTATLVAAAASAHTANRRVLTSSGTYTPPANLIFADVEVLGGGGGGGGATGGGGTSSAGGGGGGGGYGRVWLTAAQIGSSSSVTIGSYGGGSASGNNQGGLGGQSAFGTFIVANGGGGGFGCNAFTTSTPGGGGGGGGGVQASIVGAIVIVGQAGQAGIVFPAGATGTGGQGGSSPVGFGGQQGFQSDGGSAAFGGGYGTGGAGSGRSSSSLGGGSGSPGVVIITEFCSK